MNGLAQQSVSFQQMQMVIVQVGQQGQAITTVLQEMFPNNSVEQTVQLAQTTVVQIGRWANSGNAAPDAVEALRELAPNFPAAGEALTRLAAVGQTNAREAVEALRRLAQADPDGFVPALQHVVSRGGAFAQQAFQAIEELAEQGVQSARNAITQIAQGATTFAAAALALGRRLGFLALRGAATAAAGISTATLVAAASVLVAAGLFAGYLWSRGDAPVQPGPRMAGQSCPQQTPIARACPWTPAGFSVSQCNPGFCWDGGPQGSLACKQENQRVPNAHANDLNNLVCNDGFGPVRDPCTNVLLRCE